MVTAKIVEPTHPEAPATLGPDSIVWKYFGDFRTALTGIRPAILQNMLPELGEAVIQHSTFFTDTSGRIERSLPPIYNTVYGANADMVGRQVRDFHTEIKGEMPDGARYHALNPDTYFWAHATFVEWIVATCDTFIRPLTSAEKNELWEDAKIWYRRYGVSDRVLPETWDEFQAYFDRMIEEELVGHKTARYGIGFAKKGIPRPKQVPPLAWTVVRPPLNYIARLLSVGCLPPRAKELLELPWTERDERVYRRIARGVRFAGPLYDRLPLRMRYLTITIEAFTREGFPTR